MTENVNIIARALELASDPKCNSIADVKAVLFKEGYEGVHGHFSGQSMCRQMKQLIARRRASQEAVMAE